VWGIPRIIIFYAFCAFSAAVGVTTLLKASLGWKLTALNEGIQSVGFSSPWATVILTHGFLVRGYLGAYLFEPKLDEVSLSVWGRVGEGPDFSLAFLQALPHLPTYGLSINVVAAALLAVSIWNLKAPNHAPEPTPLALTPAADAPVAPADGRGSS
jgi:hypothetical protein